LIRACVLPIDWVFCNSYSVDFPLKIRASAAWSAPRSAEKASFFIEVLQYQFAAISGRLRRNHFEYRLALIAIFLVAMKIFDISISSIAVLVGFQCSFSVWSHYLEFEVSHNGSDCRRISIVVVDPRHLHSNFSVSRYRIIPAIPSPISLLVFLSFSFWWPNPTLNNPSWIGLRFWDSYVECQYPKWRWGSQVSGLFACLHVSATSNFFQISWKKLSILIILIIQPMTFHR
jgi:hypothetical protein